MLSDCTQLPGKSQTFINAKDKKWWTLLCGFMEYIQGVLVGRLYLKKLKSYSYDLKALIRKRTF